MTRSSFSTPRLRSTQSNGVYLWVALVGMVTALPLLAIIVLALNPSSTRWPSNLPRLLWTTVELCLGAGGLALVIGTAMAWVVYMYRFPGRLALKWMALLPLAMPGYIVSFVYVEAFTFAGPVQQWLRDIFQWTRPTDYWFPEIRSVGGAIFVLALALYPYVYLAALTAFMRQPMNQLHVARTLGRGPVRAFIEIALPQARAALFIGSLLVMMECMNDIGAASFFGIGTLTTAVYSTWLDQGDLAGAARLAALLLLFMGFLVYLETVAKTRTLRDAKNTGRMVRPTLEGWRGIVATLAMSLPIFLGFVLPCLLLLQYGQRRWPEAFTGDTALAIGHSAVLAGLACVATLAIALLLASLARSHPHKSINATVRLASLGYALPGTVLGIGVLVPFGHFDQWINRVLTSVAGFAPGLILSGGLFALVFAYTTRFLIIAVGHVQDGMVKIPTNMDHVARTLGRNQFAVFRSIHLPLLKPSIVAAMLLVFVDAMKELPATLILRPFDFDTLATRVFTLASLGQFEQAAIPALLIVLTGLVPVAVLSRNMRQLSDR